MIGRSIYDCKKKIANKLNRKTPIVAKQAPIAAKQAKAAPNVGAVIFLLLIRINNRRAVFREGHSGLFLKKP